MQVCMLAHNTKSFHMFELRFPMMTMKDHWIHAYIKYLIRLYNTFSSVDTNGFDVLSWGCFIRCILCCLEVVSFVVFYIDSVVLSLFYSLYSVLTLLDRPSASLNNHKYSRKEVKSQLYDSNKTFPRWFRRSYLAEIYSEPRSLVVHLRYLANTWTTSNFNGRVVARERWSGDLTVGDYTWKWKSRFIYAWLGDRLAADVTPMPRRPQRINYIELGDRLASEALTMLWITTVKTHLGLRRVQYLKMYVIQ